MKIFEGLSDLDNLRALALEIDKSYWSSLSFVNLLDVQLFSFFVFLVLRFFRFSALFQFHFRVFIFSIFIFLFIFLRSSEEYIIPF